MSMLAVKFYLDLETIAYRIRGSASYDFRSGYLHLEFILATSLKKNTAQDQED